jgi:hypothetical protein
MKQIFIVWSVVDVIDKAKSMEVTLTQYEAEKILYNVEKYHDASIGINWDVIGCHIDDFIQQRFNEVVKSIEWHNYLAK